ncbi:hypothetical protein SVIOM342S_06271 [Streptomyces violaceorubidus]
MAPWNTAVQTSVAIWATRRSRTLLSTPEPLLSNSPTIPSMSVLTYTVGTRAVVSTSQGASA